MRNMSCLVKASGYENFCKKAETGEINMPAFNTWSYENLVKFAEDSNQRMKEQQDRIEQLQNDLKDAIEAYRRRHINDND
jgi:hypothetical protein